MPANPGDIIAYATLESSVRLYGFLCVRPLPLHSIAGCLSRGFAPVSRVQTRRYGLSLLLTWKSPQGGHEGAPYPFPNQAAFTQAGSPTNTEISPFEVLMSRRPDIQHLPLTCENTNTALPYVDVVNETLEYYIANGLTLEKMPWTNMSDTTRAVSHRKIFWQARSSSWIQPIRPCVTNAFPLHFHSTSLWKSAPLFQQV